MRPVEWLRGQPSFPSDMPKTALRDSPSSLAICVDLTIFDSLFLSFSRLFCDNFVPAGCSLSCLWTRFHHCADTSAGNSRLQPRLTRLSFLLRHVQVSRFFVPVLLFTVVLVLAIPGIDNLAILLRIYAGHCARDVWDVSCAHRWLHV
jgi:hypothetical protein